MSENLDLIYDQLDALSKFTCRLDNQIGDVVDLAGKLADQSTRVGQLRVYDDAAIRTHGFILSEICAKLGVPRDVFLDHYKAVSAHYLSEVLEEAEDVSPSAAAQLDVRSQACVDECLPVTPLFP
jgi:hypothetical protein